MAYTLSNKCAKNLCKRTVLVQLIFKNVLTCFFGTTEANLAFSKLSNIWRVRTLGLSIMIRLYTSIVKAVLLYGAETWPTTRTKTQRLEVAHHKWLRRIAEGCGP